MSIAKCYYYLLVLFGHQSTLHNKMEFNLLHMLKVQRKSIIANYSIYNQTIYKCFIPVQSISYTNF